MEISIICVTVVIVSAMLTYILNKYVEKLANDKDRDALLENLSAQVKKTTERLSQVELKGFR